ncbi:MAG: hypothetical protein Q9159_007456 [Coniocarpon cinnabarinum]
MTATQEQSHDQKETALHETAKSFIKAFTTLQDQDFLSLRSTTCLQVFAPQSLNPPPPMTNSQWCHHLSKLRQILTGFPVSAKEMHVNVPKREIFIWANAVPLFKKEVKDGKEEEWDFEGEYIFLLSVDGDGKIERVLEFVDSLAVESLRGLMVRAWRNAGTTTVLF